MKKLVGVLLFLLVFVSVLWPFMFGFGMVSALLSLSETEEVSKEREYEFERGDEESENKILAVKVFGPILDDKRGFTSPFGEVISQGVTYGYQVKEELIRAAEDPEIKGVMIEVSSPGGTVTGSHAISEAIAYLRSRGKPVYGFGSGVVASGGYWVLAATEQAHVDVGSLIGSIGVIGGSFPVYNDVTELGLGVLGPNVVTREGIDLVTVTAGEGKDFGNPFRQPTEEELAVAQQGVDDVYELFVSHVADRRSISEERVVDEIGAYVYGEIQALNLELIDGVLSRESAYEELAESLGLGNDYQVVTRDTSLDFWSSVFGVVDRFREKEMSVGNKGCSLSQRVLVYYGSLEEVCGLF